MGLEVKKMNNDDIKLTSNKYEILGINTTEKGIEEVELTYIPALSTQHRYLYFTKEDLYKLLKEFDDA
jgi:hypothetical protein